MSYKVVVFDGPTGREPIEESELAKVGAEVRRAVDNTPEERLALVADADGILCDATPVDASLIAHAPKLRVVGEYGIGYDNIDVPAATARRVWVANVPGFCAEEVADYAMAVVLAANRRLFAYDRSLREGRWDPLGVGAGAARLSAQTLGVIGFGNIGRRVARRAAAFGMRVLVHSPRTTPELAREHGAERVDLPTLYARSDYVSLHLPATAATRGMIDADALAQMKPTAWLINAARGSVVDEAALLDALRQNRLAGAALDVRSSEPPIEPDPFRELPNVILTPHASYFSEHSLRELRERAARNVAAVLEGRRPANPVNEI
ncbi:MAG: C-terminal binding protein [Chloroflexota bacterium]